MPVPLLIHPVPVTIRRVNRAVTTEDANAREPVRQLWRTGDGPGTGDAVELRAQVNWEREGRIAEPKSHGGGVEENTSGYLLFSIQELLAAGVATQAVDGTVDVGIRRGDRITRIGRRSLEVFVVFFRDAGHYEDLGGAGLLEVRFASRM